MQKDYLQQALKALRPDTPNWYGWAKEDAEGNKIPNADRMTYANTIVIQDGVTKPTEEEVTAKMAEFQAEDEFITNRQKAYPSVGDQLDMIFKSGVLDGSDWAATIQAVKDKYPKGE